MILLYYMWTAAFIYNLDAMLLQYHFLKQSVEAEDTLAPDLWNQIQTQQVSLIYFTSSFSSELKWLAVK